MTWIALLLALLLLAAAAAVRAAGASLVRTPRAEALHDAAEGDARAQRIAELLEDRPRLQPAMGMVHSTFLVAAAVPATWALADLVSGWPKLFVLIVLGGVLVFFGDVLPRSWGRAHPRRLAYHFAWLLSWAIEIGDRAADLVQDDDAETDPQDESDEQEEEELELISSVLDFTDAVVREVMVPRPDMVALPADCGTDAALDVVIAEGKSRLPVFGEGADDVVGMVYAKDLLAVFDDGGADRPIAEIIRDAYFVPETKRVSELLREMQAEKVHLAVVVDEFGGTAGLVTIEDIIEELVGEIEDEYDVEEPMVIPLEAGGYLVDARLHVDALGELIGVELPDEEWDTVGGLLLNLAGRVPVEGETFELDGFDLTAERVQGRRVARVRISRR